MWETIWLWMDRFTILTAATAAVFSLMAFVISLRLRKSQKLAEAKRRAPITIRLIHQDQHLALPYRPRRDQLSRQEIMGLLSLYYGKQRFEPSIIQRVLESGELDRVLAGEDLQGDSDENLEIKVHKEFFDTVLHRLSDGYLRDPEEPNSPNFDSRTTVVDGANESRIWNLTPHPVRYCDGQTSRRFESSGKVRLDEQFQPAPPIQGLNTVTVQYGELNGWPDSIKPGDVVIVSSLVAGFLSVNQAPKDVTVLVPDTSSSAQRDETGSIVSVSRFIRK